MRESDGIVALLALLLGCGDAHRFAERAAALELSAADQRSEPHRLALLEGGHEALLARLALIRQARERIAIQTFIWSDDPVGRLPPHPRRVPYR